MLIEKLEQLSRSQVLDIYGKLWSGGEAYTAQDLQAHIRRYIVLFYNMRKFRSSCRNKAKILILAIKTI